MDKGSSPDYGYQYCMVHSRSQRDAIRSKGNEIVSLLQYALLTLIEKLTPSRKLQGCSSGHHPCCRLLRVYCLRNCMGNLARCCSGY